MYPARVILEKEELLLFASLVFQENKKAEEKPVFDESLREGTLIPPCRRDFWPEVKRQHQS